MPLWLSCMYASTLIPPTFIPPTYVPEDTRYSHYFTYTQTITLLKGTRGTGVPLIYPISPLPPHTWRYPMVLNATERR